MNTWRAFLHRLGYLPRKRRFDRQLDEELQFHVESRVDELAQQGYLRPEARARAVAEFGSRTRVAEEIRAAWQFRWLEDLVADGSDALRAFRRRPTSPWRSSPELHSAAETAAWRQFATSLRAGELDNSAR